MEFVWLVPLSVLRVSVRTTTNVLLVHLVTSTMTIFVHLPALMASTPTTTLRFALTALQSALLASLPLFALHALLVPTN